MKAKKKFPDLNKDGKITQADILKGRGVFKDGGKVPKYKKGGMAGLSAAQKEVYRRGLAASLLPKSLFTRAMAHACWLTFGLFPEDM